MIGLELVIGLALLLGGGEALVRGSVAAATRLGVSKLVIGLTLVGFGTSMPELVASLRAALAGSPGVAMGNVVGSNIANVLLILGLAAVILPIAVDRRALRRDGAVLLAASAAMTALVLVGTIGRAAGGAFLGALVVYTVATYLLERRRASPVTDLYAAEADEFAERPISMGLAIVLTLGGIAGVIIGADLLVGSAIAIASAAGVSEAVIGLTLVAVGTSLPELVTSVLAAVRRHGDVAFGNVIGSNIFNLLGIAGTTALVSPLTVPAQIARFDVWIMLGAAVALTVFAVTAARISRTEGMVLLAGYALYLAVQIVPGLRAPLGLAAL
ncbi:calcium/sodium antiporter [Rhodovulum sp. YNF3179]|uniref:calcium/sodium antiporter n=1 Tax=Rhodovulum sp. YNF3179 TaxID=3425127 RepID=UPI003D3534FF